MPPPIRHDGRSELPTEIDYSPPRGAGTRPDPGPTAVVHTLQAQVTRLSGWADTAVEQSIRTTSRVDAFEREIASKADKDVLWAWVRRTEALQARVDTLWWGLVAALAAAILGPVAAVIITALAL